MPRRYHRRMTGRVLLSAPKPRQEPIVTQYAQMILGDALDRIADEPHKARGQIGRAVKPVKNFAARRVGIKRIDGEIAPRCIFAPIVGKSDGRAAPVGRYITAQRGNLERVARR